MSFTEEEVRGLMKDTTDKLNALRLLKDQYVFLVEPRSSIADSLFVQVKSTYKESTKTYIMYTVLAKIKGNKVTIIPREDHYETFTGPFEDGYTNPYTIYAAMSITHEDQEEALRMTNGLYDPPISTSQTIPGKIYFVTDNARMIVKVIYTHPTGALVLVLRYINPGQSDWSIQLKDDQYKQYFYNNNFQFYPPESEQTRAAREREEADKLRLATLAKRQAEEATALEKKRAEAAAAEAKAVANAKAKAEANAKAIAEAKVIEQTAIQNALNTLYTVPYLDLEEGGEYYVQTTQNSSAFMKIKVSAMMDGYVICTPLSRGSILKKEGEWTNIEKPKEKATNLDGITLDDTTIFYRKKGIFSSIWPFSGGHLASRRSRSRSRSRNRNRINLNTTRKHRTTRKH